MTRVRLKHRWVLTAVSLLTALCACGGMMPTPHPDLAAVAKERTLRLSTIGRKSGKPRTTQIWFVIEGDHVFVQAGKKGRKGWLANLRSNPEVGLEIGGMKLRGRANVVSEAAEAQRVLLLVQQKYWLARVARWFGSGIGTGIPVRIEIESLP